jgi:DNA-binding MarR family transcriptional regulator
MNGPTLQEIARATRGKICGPEVRAPGPGHSPHDDSLSIKLANNENGFVVHSFAGDDPINCLDYVNRCLGRPEWQPSKGNGHNGARKPVGGCASTNTKREQAIYTYQDADGAELFQVVRYSLHRADGSPVIKENSKPAKTFLQRQRDPTKPGGWNWSVKDIPAIPYRMVDVTEAITFERPIAIVEGEAKADALAKIGIYATCNAAGAGKWTSEHSEYLRGGDIIVIRDNDEAGKRHRDSVVASLQGVARRIRTLELPGLQPGRDIKDWLDAGGTREQLDALIERAPEARLPRTSGPKLVTSGEFIRGFIPPDYLIDGILQRRFIYSITGRTGEGKTTVCLRIAAHVSEGLKLGDAEVIPGRVLYLAGENPDDIRMRWLALTETMGLDADATAVDFVDGRFKLSEIPDHILQAAQANEYALVIVDTSVAFSQTIDENDNVQQLHHAQRLRGLIDLLPGGPTILVCCHPPKNAGDDNLQPRGGGAVIAEFDGNLTSRRTETVVEVYWQGKFRGPDFAPIHFVLRGVTSEKLKDSNGRLISTVIAQPASEEDQEAMAKAATADQNKLLRAIADDPRASIATLALACGWTTKNGKANRPKVQRAIKALEKAKLIKIEDRERDGITVTDKGKRAVSAMSDTALSETTTERL